MSFDLLFYIHVIAVYTIFRFIQISIFCYYLRNGAEVLQLGFIYLEMGTQLLHIFQTLHLNLRNNINSQTYPY